MVCVGVTKVQSDVIFEVQDLITDKHSLVHANRLKFYADSSLDVTESLLDTMESNDPHYNTVMKLLNLRFNPIEERYEVQAEMEGI